MRYVMLYAVLLFSLYHLMVLILGLWVFSEVLSSLLRLEDIALFISHFVFRYMFSVSNL